MGTINHPLRGEIVGNHPRLDRILRKQTKAVAATTSENSPLSCDLIPARFIEQKQMLDLSPKENIIYGVFGKRTDAGHLLVLVSVPEGNEVLEVALDFENVPVTIHRCGTGEIRFTFGLLERPCDTLMARFKDLGED